MDKQDYQFCIRCGRRLKTPEARELGMGKICAKKYQEKETKRKLFERGNISATRNSHVQKSE